MDGRCSGGLPKNFLQPCLLLLVLEQPGYGYDLAGGELAVTAPPPTPEE